MKLLRTLDDVTDAVRHGAVTIGNFDGVHRGHARLLERLGDQARQVGGPAVVFTFDPHPIRLLRPEAAPPPLTWAERKAELLAELGVDVLLAYPTDEALLQLTPQEFFTRIVGQALQARAMVEGANFGFGCGRSGNIRTLAEFCAAAGVRLEVVEPVSDGAEAVSSSRVRQLLQAGDVAAARRMLTRPYRIRGLVTHGARRGATLGFPTANVEAVDTLVPGLGVYAGLRRHGRPDLAGGDQHRPQPDVRRTGLEIRNASDRFQRIAVRPAAGG